MMFRAIAIGTAVGIVGFFGTFLAAVFDIRSEAIAFYIFTPSLVLIAVELLVTIAHLNLDKNRSAEEKAPFRSALARSGPFAAVAYLWCIGDATPSGRERRG